MIARKAPDGGLLLLKQNDHAHLTRPLAEAWKWDVPRREETARACEVHDIGWVEWDEAPRVDADGRPFTYRRMPPEDYRDLWRRGFAQAWEEGAWVGLLVSLHGARFFEWKQDEPADARVLADERAAQTRALGRLGYADATPDALPADVERGFHLVRWLDGLSLFLCERWDDPWAAEAPDGEGAVKITVRRIGETRVTLDPWPFAADEITVEAPAYRVPRETFPDDASLRAAFADAEARTLSWTLAPGATP